MSGQGLISPPLITSYLRPPTSSNICNFHKLFVSLHPNNKNNSDMCTYSITLNDELIKQTRSSFENEDAMDKWLQQQVEALLSDFNAKQQIIVNARKAIEAMRSQSEQSGNSEMSLDEINSEIRKTRLARKNVA